MFKLFKELQDEANLPQEARLKMVKFYDKSTISAIILDNMRHKGYNTAFRMDAISIEFAELAVKQLAKFHALSYVLKERRPQYYKRKIKTIAQPFSFNEDMKELAVRMCRLAMNNLDEESRAKFKAFVSNFMERYAKCLCSESQWDVLCHGDFRPSNLLMKEEVSHDYYFKCNDMIKFVRHEVSYLDCTCFVVAKIDHLSHYDIDALHCVACFGFDSHSR